MSDLNLSGAKSIKILCNQCDYIATKRGDLLNHIKSRHEGVKYPCDQCDYKATFQVALKTHIKSIHERVKYSCDQCDFKATRKDYLSVHIKSKHEGILVINVTMKEQENFLYLFISNPNTMV